MQLTTIRNGCSNIYTDDILAQEKIMSQLSVTG